MKKLIAFTLAEILIVIGILGIVAENTIPALVQNTEKAQYLAGLKIGVAKWDQALNLMAADAGCPGDLSCFFDSDITAAKIIKYFKVVKTCAPFQSGCFAEIINAKFDNTDPSPGNYNSVDTFITKDGMAFSIGYKSPNCAYNPTGLTKTTNLDQICSSFFLMDINGLKKPNTFGRDIFAFYITTGKGPKLYPYGGTDAKYAPGERPPWYDTTNGDCNYGYLTGKNKEGISCAARIIDEGWQMNY